MIASLMEVRTHSFFYWISLKYIIYHRIPSAHRITSYQPPFGRLWQQQYWAYSGYLLSKNNERRSLQWRKHAYQKYSQMARYRQQLPSNWPQALQGIHPTLNASYRSLHITTTLY